MIPHARSTPEAERRAKRLRIAACVREVARVATARARDYPAIEAKSPAVPMRGR